MGDFIVAFGEHPCTGDFIVAFGEHPCTGDFTVAFGHGHPLVKRNTII
jgi:hypothetical protein